MLFKKGHKSLLYKITIFFF